MYTLPADYREDHYIILFVLYIEMQVIGWFFHPLFADQDMDGTIDYNMGKFIINLFNTPIIKPYKAMRTKLVKFHINFIL